MARALAPAPRLVVLDEPFSGLDSSLRRAVSEQVATALRAAGATALLITHDASEAFRTADRVAFLDRGQLVQVGAPDDLYERPTDLRAATAAGTTTLVTARRDGSAVVTPLGDVPVEHIGHVSDVTVGVLVLRPWQLQIVVEPGSDVEVLAARPDTDTLWVTVAIGGEHVDLCTARTAQDLDCLTPGTRIRVDHARRRCVPSRPIGGHLTGGPEALVTSTACGGPLVSSERSPRALVTGRAGAGPQVSSERCPRTREQWGA